MVMVVVMVAFAVVVAVVQCQFRSKLSGLFLGLFPSFAFNVGKKLVIDRT